ncbi:hypothetical protein BYT27DRAFT_7216786 [Phlegmacium glaucopus]|nr:hypothetical protein BYT27DRAFT_7216786 [Phlegmacium glaucopus]
MAQLKVVINTMMEKLGQFAKDITRVSQEVGTEGELGGKALVLDVEGTWRELTAVFSKLAASSTSQIMSAGGGRSRKSRQTRRSSTCTGRGRGVVEFGSEHQLRSTAVVTTAVARGDLTQKIEISVEGFVGGVNSMMDQLSAFAFEVTRLALEVGTQVAFVNVDVQEEILDLKTTVNSMAAQLGTLEVIRVSLELRREGILGGQAVLPNCQGMWKVLTDNANLMAINLTNQGRSIAEVTKAVAGGDLTKTMSVERSWN